MAIADIIQFIHIIISYLGSKSRTWVQSLIDYFIIIIKFDAK